MQRRFTMKREAGGGRDPTHSPARAAGLVWRCMLCSMQSRLLRFAAIAVLAGVSLAMRSEQALACSCEPPGPPLEELERSAAVFSGELVSIDGVIAPILTFEVFRVWKGPVVETLVLTTRSLGAGDCGYPFKAGREYIVYADAARGSSLVVWLCSRTGYLERAQADLEALGEGQIPGQGAAAPEAASPVRGDESPAPSPPKTGSGVAAGQSATGGETTGLMAALAIVLAGLAFFATGHSARRG